MALEINWREIGERAGSGEIEITVPEGEYLQMRHGSLGNPTVDLQIQTEVGKSITYYIRITASEQSA
jgi:hypothetical protein